MFMQKAEVLVCKRHRYLFVPVFKGTSGRFRSDRCVLVIGGLTALLAATLKGHGKVALELLMQKADQETKVPTFFNP